jgi:hypothetical protein
VKALSPLAVSGVCDAQTGEARAMRIRQLSTPSWLSTRPSRSSNGARRPPSEEEMVPLMDGCDALGAAYAPIMRALFTFGTYTLMPRSRAWLKAQQKRPRPVPVD